MSNVKVDTIRSSSSGTIAEAGGGHAAIVPPCDRPSRVRHVVRPRGRLVTAGLDGSDLR
jgi:hypothetical protein